jgi:hypothetical protein
MPHREVGILLTPFVDEGHSPVFHGGEGVNKRPRDCSGCMNLYEKEDMASKIAAEVQRYQSVRT